MSSKERACWYALFLTIAKHMSAEDSLRAMGLFLEGRGDYDKEAERNY